MVAVVESNTERLQRILHSPEPTLSLAEAALVIARDEYPALDVDAYLHKLDGARRAVRAELPAKRGWRK